MPPKRVKDEVEGDSNVPKPRAKKPKAGSEPHVDEFGFHVYDPPSLLYKDWNSKPNTKVAAFDMDGTLILTKSGAQFAKGPDDWKFFSKKVIGVVQDFHKSGHKILIVSNQGAVKSAVTGKAASNVKQKLNQIVEALGVPAVAVMATLDDEFRKPTTGMWDFFVEKLNGGVVPDKSSCFFVGDMAGRPTDPNQSTSDKDFAANIGIEFKLPEDLFGQMDGKHVLAKAKPAEGGPPLADGPNTELAAIFAALSEHYFKTGVATDKFKAASCKKVGSALAAYPNKVAASNLKEVNSIAGIGKGSMLVIKEYVDTGKVQALEDIKAGGGGADAAPASPAAAAAAAKPPTKAQEQALKFM